MVFVALAVMRRFLCYVIFRIGVKFINQCKWNGIEIPQNAKRCESIVALELYGVKKSIEKLKWVSVSFSGVVNQ